MTVCSGGCLRDFGPRTALTIFVFQAPEIQTMYHIPKPVSAIRARMRQEFERQRFINKLPVVDVLLFKSAADYQVSISTSRPRSRGGGARGGRDRGPHTLVANAACVSRAGADTGLL